MGTLTTGVQALQAKVDGAPAKTEPGPSRWAWQHATADQAAWLWAGLGPWVRWLTDRYPTQLRDLPPCWHLHGDAVEELTALWASWMSAYHGPDQPRDDMIYWHDRWFPAATGRLLGPAGTLINCAKAKQHREPNLAGAPRHHFDDTGMPTLEEYAAADVVRAACHPPAGLTARSGRKPSGRSDLRQSGRPGDRTPIAPATYRDPGAATRRHWQGNSFVPRTSSPGHTGRRSTVFRVDVGSAMDEPQESPDEQQRAASAGALSPVAPGAVPVDHRSRGLLFDVGSAGGRRRSWIWRSSWRARTHRARGTRRRWGG